MKKKFLAMYALVGAFIASPIFTSCVDDEESATVTAIRDAKTAELKSIAALKKAEAAAQATLDAAYTALKNAQAEAQLAQAKLYEAQAALKETQNQEEAIRLQVQKQEAEAELARIQGEIEKQKLEIERELLYAQAELIAAKKQLDQATQNYEANEKAQLMVLANRYENAVNQLMQAKKELVNMESNLAAYENNLATAKQNLEKDVAYWNGEIAKAEIRIEAYKQLINYTADFNTLLQDRAKAQANSDLAMDKWNAADKKYFDAREGIDQEKLNELFVAVEEDAYRRFAYNWEIYDEENESWIWIGSKNWDMMNAIMWTSTGENTFVATGINTWGVEYEYNDKTFWEGDSIAVEVEQNADYRDIELRAMPFVNSLKADIKAVEEIIKTNKTAYEAAVKATADAKKAWDDAAEADKAAKKAAYETALANELGLKATIEMHENNVEGWKKELACWNSTLDIVKNQVELEAALQAKIKAYNDANKEAYAPVVEAKKAQLDAQNDYEEAYAALEAIDTIVYGWNYTYGAEDIDNAIKNVENSIENYKNNIEEAEKLLSDGSNFSWEELIAWQKDKIEAQKAVVAAKEVAVKEAKAALDAAMPTEE